MAFLAPLAAKGVATTAATTSLGAGLKLGTTIGGLTAPAGFTLAPTLGGAGSSLLTGGSLLAPTAGGGLGSLLTAGGAGLKAAPLLAPGAGSLLAPAAGSLGSALTPTGLASLKMPAGSLLKGGATLAGPAPSSFSAVNQAVGLGDLGVKSAQLNPSFIKTASNVPQTGGNFTKGLLESGAKIKPAPSVVPTSPNIEAMNKSVIEAIQASKEVPRVLPAQAQRLSPVIEGENFLSNFVNVAKDPSLKAAGDYIEKHPYASAAAGYGLLSAMQPKPKAPPEKSPGLIRPYDFDYNPNAEAYATSPTDDSSEQLYFSPTFTAQTPYEAPGPEYRKAAEGGLMGLAVGGPVEMMAAQNAVGANTGYPMAGINTAMYSNPMVQRPEATNVISPSGDAGVGAYSGEPKFAGGGISHLGDYSDGGRLLKGPGDGVSDSIPASIGGRQPARLADGEFVIPARIVSEIGNGSTEAGARKLYAMMDRVQKARSKTVGKKKVAVNTRADKHLPA